MLVVYLLARLVLAFAHLFVRFRVRRLEKRFVNHAGKVSSLLEASAKRGGTNKNDSCLVAKQQYELALAGLQRDRVEARYTSWQSFSERFGKFRAALAGFRGRLVPYLFGLADVTGLVVLMNQFSVGVNDVIVLIGL